MKAVEFYGILEQKNLIKVPKEIADKIGLHKNESVKIILLREEDEEASREICESKELTASLKRIRKNKKPKSYSYEKVFKS